MKLWSRDGAGWDDDGQRWKDRHEGWNIYVDYTWIFFAGGMAKSQWSDNFDASQACHHAQFSN